jgi:hypothetical protein
LFPATRHWSVSLHVNKGLAGAPPETIEAASDTAMNPAVLNAFALAISGAEGPPAFPGIPGHEPDIVTAPGPYRRVVEAAAKLPCKAALIDGELIIQDENGISDFDALPRPSTKPHIG